jgi:microcystin-dependent protein
MSDPYVGELRLVGFNFAPLGWELCQGQELSISVNDVLFTLIGTTYGGDGQTTFALPDLRGRAPVHRRPATGAAGTTPGQSGGAETVALTLAGLPGHSHVLTATTDLASDDSPTGRLLAGGGSYGPTGSSPSAMADTAIGASGLGEPHDNLQPYLGVNWIIALYGIYPAQA